MRESLNTFLSKCVCKDDPNLVSLRGGRWHIKPEQVDRFFILYERTAKRFTEEHAKSLTFQWPQIKRLPIVLDFDLKYDSEVSLDSSELANFVKLIAEGIPETVEMDDNLVEWYIVRKETGYWKQMATGKTWKNGFHVYFPTLRATLEETAETRKYVMPLVPDHFSNYTNTVADIVDEALVKRRNGTMLIGDFKKTKGSGGRYQAVPR